MKYGLFLKENNECVSVYQSNYTSLRYKVDMSEKVRVHFIEERKTTEEEFEKLYYIEKVTN